ncbi:hypothetical protein ACHAXS_010456 [Conticribra weissflogii]
MKCTKNSKKYFQMRQQALSTLAAFLVYNSGNNGSICCRSITAFAPHRRATMAPPSSNMVSGASYHHCSSRRGNGAVRSRCRVEIKRRASTSLNMSSTPRPPSSPNLTRFPFPKNIIQIRRPDKAHAMKTAQDSAIESAVETTNDSENERRRSFQMATVSAICLTLAVGVIYSLASSGTDVEPGEVKNFLGYDASMEKLESATRKIVNVALPQSADDVIAVSIGEGIAGAIGAVATWLLGTILKFRVEDDVDDLVARVVMTTEELTGKDVNLLISGAVAEGDYFLTRAAASPLFEAVGIPTFLASLASVLLATLPYEAIKLSQQKKIQLQRDAILMDMLLKEEALRMQQRGGPNIVDEISNNILQLMQKLDVRKTNTDVVDDSESTILQNLPPPPLTSETNAKQKNDNTEQSLDYIEIFADITKWLEYDVLIRNYRGILSIDGHPLNSGLESAIFGLLAALSSQLYTDVLYIYSDLGNPTKREKTLNRSIDGWTSLYATKCLSSATLFGVYEAARAPTSRFMRQLVSGGVEGCAGSDNFDLCMESYLLYNPPVATYQAEFRAFVVSAIGWVDKLTDLVPLNDQETFESFARGTIVSMYSVLDRFFSFFSS